MDPIRSTPVSADDSATCSHCGFRAAPDTLRQDNRPLIAVVDELGRSLVCGLCLVTVLARAVAAADVTVFVSRPTAAVAR